MGRLHSRLNTERVTLMTIELKNTGFIIYEGNCPPLGKITVPCQSFNYRFISGVYILSGNIDDGGFALSYLLGGTYTKKQLVVYDEGNILVDNYPVSISEFKNIGCYLGDHQNKKYKYFSVKKLIEFALKKSKLPYNTDDIRKLFHIDKDRFERTLNKVGITIWQCIAAIGFAEGKKLYTFPWFSPEKQTFFGEMFKIIIPVLKENNCIVMIPATDFEQLEGLYDYEVNLKQLFLSNINKNNI